LLHLCKACTYRFTAKTPIVQKNSYISQNVKAQVILKSAEAQSLMSMATVPRLINQADKQSEHKQLRSKAA